MSQATIWRAGLEAQQVIALRLAKLARGGPSATAEANRMVAEKMATAAEALPAAAIALPTGKAAQIPATTVALYRRKMRAKPEAARVTSPPISRKRSAVV